MVLWSPCTYSSWNISLHLFHFSKHSAKFFFGITIFLSCYSLLIHELISFLFHWHFWDNLEVLGTQIRVDGDADESLVDMWFLTKKKQLKKTAWCRKKGYFKLLKIMTGYISDEISRSNFHIVSQQFPLIAACTHSVFLGVLLVEDLPEHWVLSVDSWNHSWKVFKLQILMCCHWDGSLSAKHAHWCFIANWVTP